MSQLPADPGASPSHDYAVDGTTGPPAYIRKEQRPEAIEQRYTRLFNLVREGLAHYKAIYDDTGKLVDLLVLDINPAGAKLSGVAPEDQVGRTWRQVWPDVDQRLFDIYGRADNSGETIRFEEANILTGRTYDVTISRVQPGEFVVTFFDITDRKQAEEGLRRAAELIELGDACLELDRSWRIVRVNANQERLSAKSRSETLGRIFWDVWPETATAGSDYWREYHRCMEERVPVQFDAYYEPLDLWTGVTAYPTETGIAVFFRDVSEKKRAEQELNRSEARMRAVFDALSEGVVFLNTEGAVEEANSAVTRVLGHTVRELADPEIDPRFRIIRPDGTPKPVEEQPAILALRTGNPVREVELGVPRADGTIGWLLASAELVRDDQGKMLGAVASFFDISERKAAEQSLRESEQRYRQLFDSMREGFFVAEVVTDVSGAPVDYRFLEVNASLERMTGLRREDLLGGRVTDVIPGVDPYWIEIFGNVAITGKPAHFERYSTPLDRWYEGFAYCPRAGQFATTFVDVTERKRTEEALRDSTERLLLAVQATELGAFDYFPSSGKLIWSGFAKQHFGLAPDAQVSYDTFLKGIHPEDRERIARLVQDVMTPGGSGEYHAQYRTVGIQDGQERWLDARGRVYFDNAGAPARFVGTTRDMTARRMRERQLEELQHARERERELLQAIIDNIPVMLCVFDPTLRRFTVNREVEKLLGWTTADANDGDFMAKAYPDTAYRQEVAAYMRSLSPGWREIYVTAKNGTRVASEWANIGLADDRMIGIGIDVRERKRTEAALRLNLRQLQATFDGMVEPVLLADRHANVIAMNSAYLELFEYQVAPRTREELLQDFLFTLPDGSPLPLQDSPFSRAMRGEVVRDLELRAVNKRTGKQFHILTGAAPVRDADGQIAAVIITSHDITRRKRAEQAVERSNLTLRQFAYAAAHDLQEPLRNVAIASELLERRYAAQLDSQAHRLLATNVEGARRMHRMVKDLLEYTKVTEGLEVDPTLVDASLAVKNALANLEAAINASSAQIHVEPLPRLRVHETHLVQVFQNLISNSLKYRKASEVPAIHIRADRSGSEWIFSVEDNGIGFDPTHRDRIFGVFKRLHGRDKYPGTGIGLAICTRIVEHYGGRIWADAIPDQGAVFYFSLPADGAGENHTE